MAQSILENLKVYCKKVSDRRFVESCGDLMDVRKLSAEKQVRWFLLVDEDTQVEALHKCALRNETLFKLLAMPEFTDSVAKYVCPANIREASSTVQILWFKATRCNYREDALRGGHLSDLTLDKLFCDPKYFEMVAPYMSLSDEQFRTILRIEGFCKCLNGVTKKTLSEQKVRDLIKWTVLRSKESCAKQWQNVLYAYIVREGLPVRLIPFVEDYPEEEMGSIKDLIKKASEVHAHVYAVVSGMYNCEPSPAFIRHLSYLSRENISMPDEAAVLMKGSQVIAFHNAGLHLSQKAIATLLANDDVTSENGPSPMYESILKNEIMYPMWPELKLVLEAKQYVYQQYERAVNLREIKKADS